MPVPGQLDPMWEDDERRRELLARIDAMFPVRQPPLMPMPAAVATPEPPTNEPTGTRDSGDEDPHA